jgi:rhodanese-related sulfurtransferase
MSLWSYYLSHCSSQGEALCGGVLKMNLDMQSKKGLGKVFAFVVLAMLTVGLCSTLLTSCSDEEVREESDEEYESITESPQYRRINASEARQIMNDYSDVVVLDVRTEEEFSMGHIPGAVLVPSSEIADWHRPELKDTPILIYCRSGNRSATAAQELINRGYLRVFDFGGIIDWPYEIE